MSYGEPSYGYGAPAPFDPCSDEFYYPEGYLPHEDVTYLEECSQNYRGNRTFSPYRKSAPLIPPVPHNDTLQDDSPLCKQYQSQTKKKQSMLCISSEPRCYDSDSDLNMPLTRPDPPQSIKDNPADRRREKRIYLQDTACTVYTEHGDDGRNTFVMMIDENDGSYKQFGDYVVSVLKQAEEEMVDPYEVEVPYEPKYPLEEIVLENRRERLCTVVDEPPSRAPYESPSGRRRNF